MSNPDSFIEEVTEEVRRDRLFNLMRRYGWIAITAVVLLVVGAAYNEWQKARDMTAAQAFGDAVLTAIEAPTPEERAAGLAGGPWPSTGRPRTGAWPAARAIATSPWWVGGAGRAIRSPPARPNWRRCSSPVSGCWCPCRSCTIPASGAAAGCPCLPGKMGPVTAAPCRSAPRDRGLLSAL